MADHRHTIARLLDNSAGLVVALGGAVVAALASRRSPAGDMAAAWRGTRRVAGSPRGPARVARATGATPRLEEGASEPLLIALEEGKLDLVIGPLSPESPWVSRVALLEPIGETVTPQRLSLTPIARNGENRWIMLLEAEARPFTERTKS